MSRESKIILWLGLIMILVQIVRDWSQIKSSLFGSGGQGASGKAPFSIIPPILPWTINPNEPAPGETPPAEPPPVEAPPPAEVPPLEIPPIALGRQPSGGRAILWLSRQQQRKQNLLITSGWG